MRSGKYSHSQDSLPPSAVTHRCLNMCLPNVRSCTFCIVIIIIIIIITIFIERTNSSKLESEARWGTWLAGKGKEVSFETVFKRISGW